MQQLVRSQRFALVELLFVMFCGAVWIIKPDWGIWFILVALLPLILKVLFGHTSSRRLISFDWLVFIFLVTAWVGYWAAYDETIAWKKLWFIVLGVLLYYSLSTQPRDNLTIICMFFFCIGVGIAFYYFLTHDFVAVPRKIEFVNRIGRWIMTVRPQTGWKPIHPNYVAGMIAVSVPFVFYPVGKCKITNRGFKFLLYIVVVIGLGLAFITLFMATSRGVVMAIVSGAGAWFLWRLINLTGIVRLFTSQVVFPILLLFYLCLIVVLLFIGPAQSGSVITDGKYGNGSRGELFERSTYLVFDYPITGGGLSSFPGLYSRYILNIPFFYLPNSHNMFLDVAIEQGLLGGMAFLLLYVASLWMVSSSIANGIQEFKWILLFSLIVAFIHGMVDDYLYNGVGSVFSLFLVGLSANESRGDSLPVVHKVNRQNAIMLVIACGLLIVPNINQVRGLWYANLGAVQLSKVELAAFPDNDWPGIEIVPKLEQANSTLLLALQFDPFNRTANQRLGMVSMLKYKFQPAADHLEVALKNAPGHRGVIKSLGYCYVWLGDMKEGQLLLLQIPEAKEELDVYTWWWGIQGRSDFSENAALALKMLNVVTPQP